MELKFEHNGYIFDESQSTLQFKDNKILLTKKERLILLELFYAKGGTVEFQHFMEKIWSDFMAELGYGRLNVHMTYLRKKIRSLGNNQTLIATVRQKGYQLA